MGRTRIENTDLPMRLYKHHGGYRYVTSQNGEPNVLYLGQDRKFAIPKAKDLNSLSRLERNRLIGRLRNVHGEFRKKIFERDGYQCLYCQATEDLILDHFIPFEQGGATHPMNLVTCCVRCNDRKHDRSPAEYFAVVNGLREHIIEHIFCEFITQNPEISHSHETKKSHPCN